MRSSRAENQRANCVSCIRKSGRAQWLLGVLTFFFGHQVYADLVQAAVGFADPASANNAGAGASSSGSAPNMGAPREL